MRLYYKTNSWKIHHRSSAFPNPSCFRTLSYTSISVTRIICRLDVASPFYLTAGHCGNIWKLCGRVAREKCPRESRAQLYFSEVILRTSSSWLGRVRAHNRGNHCFRCARDLLDASFAARFGKHRRRTPTRKPPPPNWTFYGLGE